MLDSALHLLVAVAVTATGYMSGTVFSVFATMAIGAVPSVVALFNSGLGGMTAHWKATLGWSVGAICLLWIGLFTWATVSNIYADHVAARKLIYGVHGQQGLRDQIKNLNNQIDGPDGYKPK